MTIETGYELLDAIVNNPIQSLVMFGLIFIGYKFFFGCYGFWADLRRDIKYSVKYDFERKLDHFYRWCVRRDNAYTKWAKTKTEKHWLKYSIMLWSSLLIPLMIWNVFFPEEETNYFLVTVLIIEYFAMITFSVYSYKKSMKRQIMNGEQRNG